jgi:hypothetical protein
MAIHAASTPKRPLETPAAWGENLSQPTGGHAMHEVTFNVPGQRPLGRADAKFFVKVDGELLGTLAISNGSVVWWPKNTTNGYKMDWSQLDRLMRRHATREERR